MKVNCIVVVYRYDGASRRVSKDDGTHIRHYYYSDRWQVLEERLDAGTSADRQYVWGVRSIDDLILRDDAGLRLYALNDAMGSVTAVVDTSGSVQERYGYNGFGAPRYMDASFSPRTGSDYDWETLFDGYRYDTGTGLYQVRYRYLHPKLGRWLSRDLIGELGYRHLMKHSAIEIAHLLTKERLFLYTYVNNNIIYIVDIIGLFGLGKRWHKENPLSERICASPKAESLMLNTRVKHSYGHSDFTGGDRFDYTLEDRDPSTSPTLWGEPSNHFQPQDISNQQVENAIDDCNVDAFQRAMHRGQDFQSHYNKGFRWNPPFEFGHLCACPSPDDDEKAWEKAEKWTKDKVDKWDKNCKKNKNGEWVNRK